MHYTIIVTKKTNSGRIRNTMGQVTPTREKLTFDPNQQEYDTSEHPIDHHDTQTQSTRNNENPSPLFDLRDVTPYSDPNVLFLELMDLEPHDIIPRVLLCFENRIIPSDTNYQVRIMVLNKVYSSIETIGNEPLLKYFIILSLLDHEFTKKRNTILRACPEIDHETLLNLCTSYLDFRINSHIILKERSDTSREERAEHENEIIKWKRIKQLFNDRFNSEPPLC